MANVGTKSSELESIKYRKKSRRGFNRKGKGNISLTLSILGNNVDGLKNKVESLLNNISCFKPSIITLQETKLNTKGMVRLNGYEIFEQIRTDKGGGGLLTAVDENLDPEIVTEGTVQIKAGEINIRVINAYGPQEDVGTAETVQFWLDLEEEIITAKDNNCWVLVQLDANAKVGKDFIENDPHTITGNGVLLSDVVNRQNLLLIH